MIRRRSLAVLRPDARAGFGGAGMPDPVHRHPSSTPSPSAIRSALGWAPEAPDTIAHPAPERRARDIYLAAEGPRPVEDDPTPSSRSSALISMGVGMGEEEVELDRLLHLDEQRRDDL